MADGQVAAYSYKQSIGQPFLYPHSLDLIENSSHDVRGPVGAVSSHAHDRPRAQAVLILHADHEQNCSTSTVRMVGSAERTSTRRRGRVDALGALCKAAPIQAVVEMLETIRDEAAT